MSLFHSKIVRNLFLLVAISCFLFSCTKKRSGPPRVLVFTKTSGFHHASIPDGVKAIEKMGGEKGFLVDTTSDASMFTEDTLKQYSAVIFLSTTGNVLDSRQQADFERYIQAGGGYLGVHAAADCEYHWPWYGKLVGAYFKSHPQQQEATLHIQKDKNFPITDSLPDPWKRRDEWYNFRKPPEDVHVLVSIDEKSYEGGSNGDNHPMVWYHAYDGGRAFYMELGHTSESYTEPAFLSLLWAGIHYAIGKNEVLDYNKATALRKPDEDRFEKKFLGGGLDEPTELTVLPDLSVLIGERKGGIQYYNAKDSTIKEVAHIPVYAKALHVKGVNVETGLLGIQADPHYDKNHWVYVYYSPVDTSVDRLSRFKFENDQFNVKSEQVILEVHTDREICCHTGGSIAFDSKDNLYLSVGDNTTPFDEPNPVTGKSFPVNLHGFSPLDDRPGFAHYDDRRAAGNSNDLRGKILRIHVNDDGTYSIPEGNLFPKGTPNTRPEIYVMGDRNPYRISVDKHTGNLYWGEVGPDAGNDSLETRGPRGYDEVNQARKAGNFGWPYFVGNNYAYHEYDYATGTPGPAFDPEHIVNNSRNNTGVKDLPAAQPAFIWYPYAESPDFPILGKGGRCAMAGPVYYVGDHPQQTRFPEYYNGKLFIYDWIRNWVMAVTMNKEGDLQTIEPFMEHTKFHNISDMETGPDGRIYIVEYGEGWFAKNADAALSVITYNGGNRPPVAAIKIDKTSGTLPLTVHVSAVGSQDPDGDALTYSWDFGDGKKTQTDSAGVDHTFSASGTYPVSVVVSDGKGGEAKSSVKQVFAGNSRPQVDIQLTGGNPVFYFPSKKVSYQVKVSDAEDGSSDASGFDQGRVFVQADYLQSEDKAALPAGGSQHLAAALAGKSLMESLDCKSCHQVDSKSIGPAFKEVALRYHNQKDAVNVLSEKVIKGGSGNWGETAMAAHPDLAKPDAEKIVSWILSLAGDNKENSLPLQGTFVPDSKFSLTPEGVVVISASYIDQGAKGVHPLTGTSRLILHNPLLAAGHAKASSGVSSMDYNGMQLKLIGGNNGWISFPKISLQDVRSLQIKFGMQKAAPGGWELEAHLDSPDGTLIGKTNIGKNAVAMKPAESNLPVQAAETTGLHDLYLVLHKVNDQDPDGIALLSVQLKD